MLGVEDSTSLRRALVLLTVAKHFWPQLAPHVSMSLAAVFRAVQGSCPALLFKAWKLSQEFRLAADWHQRLPPTLLAVEQQELSTTGHMVWRQVEGSKVRFVLGTPVRLRCWIWSADPQQYVWSLNGARQPAAAWFCPLHNVLKSEIVLNAPGMYQCIATSPDGRTSLPTNIEVCFDNYLHCSVRPTAYCSLHSFFGSQVVLSTSEEQGDFVARLFEQQGAELDGLGRRLGSDIAVPLRPSRDELRACAFAFRELGDEFIRLSSGSPDEHLVIRRCGLPATVSITVAELLRQLSAATLFGTKDMTLLWMLSPSLPQDPRTACLLSIPGVQKLWFQPMHDFCTALQPGPGSLEQRALVRAMLVRCGWNEDSAVVSLVLDTLCWDTVELLHFALQLLRQQHATLWLPLAAVLEKAFGSDAVLPLRKALDPELTLALVVAAPEHVVRRRRRIRRRRRRRSSSHFALFFWGGYFI